MDNATKTYVCYHCDQQFLNLMIFKQHNREVHNENKPHKCGICDKTYTNETELNDHTYTHMGGQRYLWEFCEKLFTTRHNIIYHIRAKHNTDKKYKCNVCGEVSKSYYSLRYHMETRHTEKVYICNQCPAKYTHPMSLKRHMKVHTDEKIHHCEICDKKFLHKYTLNEHKFVHSDQNYACEVYGITYKRKRDLNRHIRNKGHVQVTSMTSEEQIATNNE